MNFRHIPENRNNFYDMLANLEQNKKKIAATHKI